MALQSERGLLVPAKVASVFGVPHSRVRCEEGGGRLVCTVDIVRHERTRHGAEHFVRSPFVEFNVRNGRVVRVVLPETYYVSPLAGVNYSAEPVYEVTQTVRLSDQMVDDLGCDVETFSQYLADFSPRDDAAPPHCVAYSNGTITCSFFVRASDEQEAISKVRARLEKVVPSATAYSLKHEDKVPEDLQRFADRVGRAFGASGAHYVYTYVRDIQGSSRRVRFTLDRVVVYPG